jgi:hypothetical protein
VIALSFNLESVDGRIEVCDGESEGVRAVVIDAVLIVFLDGVVNDDGIDCEGVDIPVDAIVDEAVELIDFTGVYMGLATNVGFDIFVAVDGVVDVGFIVDTAGV